MSTDRSPHVLNVAQQRISPRCARAERGPCAQPTRSCKHSAAAAATRHADHVRRTCCRAAVEPAPRLERARRMEHVSRLCSLTPAHRPDSLKGRSDTSIGHNPFTETIYFRKYSVYEGFLGENTRLRESRRRLDFGRFCVILGSFGLFGPVFA